MSAAPQLTLDLFAAAPAEPAGYAPDVTRTLCGPCLPGSPDRHADCVRDRFAARSDEHGRAFLCSCPCWNPPLPEGD